ncbi:MAG TPA: hypothetical protein VKQ27_16645, partial [Acetobacteraceae bacterium]|nr:hypothetical protein [Acetobacteraceae bacterium]
MVSESLRHYSSRLLLRSLMARLYRKIRVSDKAEAMERASIFSVSRLRSSGLTFARPTAYSDRLTVRQPGELVL